MMILDPQYWLSLAIFGLICFCFGVYIENRTTRAEREKELLAEE